MRPENRWGLKNYCKKPRETLHDYIQHFSRHCNKIFDTVDVDVIGALLSGTTYKSLVHKLEWKSPQTINELLDIATIHASGEEAVDAIIIAPARR